MIWYHAMEPGHSLRRKNEPQGPGGPDRQGAMTDIMAPLWTAWNTNPAAGRMADQGRVVPHPRVLNGLGHVADYGRGTRLGPRREVAHDQQERDVGGMPQHRSPSPRPHRPALLHLLALPTARGHAQDPGPARDALRHGHSRPVPQYQARRHLPRPGVIQHGRTAARHHATVSRRTTPRSSLHAVLTKSAIIRLCRPEMTTRQETRHIVTALDYPPRDPWSHP